MTKPLKSLRNVVLLAFIANATANGAFAVEVSAGLSARETYVGLPVTLQIQVGNAEKIDPPTLPAVGGLQIKSMGTPARSTQITTINGRTTTRSSLTYVYQITPLRAGSFHIPSITIHADGADRQTPPLAFVASKSDTGDLMFVEIAGKKKQIYVGQALDVTLKIWIRPYRDREHQITLSEADMWKLVSDRTNWGMFADRIQDLAAHDQRPTGKEVLRKDSSEVERGYYLYEVDATIYPKRPGRIDASGVRIVVDYPTSIGKARDPFAEMFDDMRSPGGASGLFGDDRVFSPFASRLAVQSVRPIVGETSADEITVLPIPSVGRPDDYRGAVGKYAIAAEANPINVKAGDRIELSIVVSGTGPMELVEAPPLAELSALTSDFKVPTEPLAGFVKNNQKLFSVTIRPRHAGISKIPAIPFSFFDPTSRRFETVHSDPISLHVAPGDTLALDEIVGREKSFSSAATSPGKVGEAAAVPKLAIYSGERLLTNEAPADLHPQLFLLTLAMPPVIVLGMLMFRTGCHPLRFLSGWKSDARRFKERIEKARRAPEVAAALQSYLASRLRLRLPSSNAENVLGQLRSFGYRQLAIRCERLFDACTDKVGPASGRRTLNELKTEARQIAEDFQVEKQRTRPRPFAAKQQHVTLEASLANSKAQIRTGAVALIVLVAVSFFSRITAAADGDPPTLTLTHTQQLTILSEATECLDKANRAMPSRSADAKGLFAKAAEKFQLLVDSGVHNSKLYVNLANAYRESGQFGKAIVNYRRALRVDPTNVDARVNLEIAEQSAHSFASLPDLIEPNSRHNSAWETAVAYYGAHVSPRVARALVLAAWCVLWMAIGFRLVGFRFPWRTMSVPGGVVFVVAAMLCTACCRETAKPRAVVVSSNAVLFDTDSASRAPIAGAAVREGQTVEPLKQRGDWLQIRTNTGQTGWLNGGVVEII